MSKLSLRRIEQLLKELFPFFAFLSLTFGFFLFSLPPKANAATNYSYYRAITVTSSTSVASGTNANFPMLVSNTIASLASVANGGAIQHLTTAPNGGIEPADLIFTSDSGCSSPLNFETESYSSSTGALVDWVNVPSLSAGTVIYACYDNTLVTTDQSHPSSTWNANYEAVYHLSEGAGSTGYDSTGVNNTTWNGTGGGSASTYYTTGNIGSYAGFFDGTSNYTQTTNTAWLPTGSAARTLMGWIKTSVTARQAYFGYGPPGAGETFNIESGISGAGKIYFVGYADDVSGNADIADGKWHQIAATYDGSKLTLYVDGQYDSSGTVALNTSITNPFVIGRQSYEDGSTFWYNAGSISDVALVNTNLSSSWILTEYNNQNSPSSFYATSAQMPENTATAIPVITSLSPIVGNILGGTSVTITGTGFTGATAVDFGSTAAISFTAASDTSITAISPAESPGTVNVTITNSLGTNTTSTADHFTYYATPVITGISAISGSTLGGTSVTITGTGFTGTTAVDFGSTPATSFTVNSDTSITAVSPAGTVGTTVDITVTTPNDTSATSTLDQFLYNGWYNTSWGLRQQITINSSLVGEGTEDETNFPVLIKLTGLSYINANASDIRFTTADGITLIPREIESYASGTLTAWVNVPTVSHIASTSIYMYYDNAAATEPAATSTYGSQAVWNNGYAAVWHLDEGGGSTAYDSTGNGSTGTWNGTAAGTGGTYYTPGTNQPYTGHFNGTDNRILVNSSAALTSTTNLTASAWVRTTTSGSERVIVANLNPASLTSGFWMGEENSDFFVCLGASSGQVCNGSGTNYFDGNRHLLTFTYNNITGVWTWYMDGSPVKTLTNAVAIGGAPYATLIGQGTWGADDFWNGSLNNIRISSVARSAGWVATEYNNQNSPSSFYAVSSPAAQGISTSVPTVTSIAPVADSTLGGTSVTITGTGFTGTTAVDFGSTPATSFTVASDTSITAVSPAGTAGMLVDMTVTNSSGTNVTSSLDQFRYYTPAAVTGISGISGSTLGGTSVTITGTGFTGTTAVDFGSTPATSFTVASDTSITAVSPAGTVGMVDVTVINPVSTSATSFVDKFIYSVVTSTPAFTASSSQLFGINAISSTGFSTLPYFKADGTVYHEASSHDPTGDNFDQGNCPMIDGGTGNCVLLDVKGSGEIDRIWMTDLTPGGFSVQIYFDGETTPRINTNLGNLLNGANAPFLQPLVGYANTSDTDDGVGHSGYSIDLPMEFSKSVKIETSAPSYYNIDYRTFATSTGVTTFDPIPTDSSYQNPSAAVALWSNVTVDPKNTAGNTGLSGTATIGAGASSTIANISGFGAVNSIKFQVASSSDNDATLNNVWIKMYWDGQTTPSVNAPFSMFFADSQYGTTHALPVGKDASGTYYSYFPMPYDTSAKIVLVNQNGSPVNMTYQVQYNPAPYLGLGNSAGYFSAYYNDSTITPLVAGQDYELLNLANAKGQYIGMVYSSPNGGNLEGNAEVYVDGSLTPQIQGTGTEDWFGGSNYWQDGAFTQATKGVTFPVTNSVEAYRFDLNDPISFNNSIKLGIQHGATDNYECTVSSLVYYYALPNSGISLTDTIAVGSSTSRTAHNYTVTGEVSTPTNSYYYEGEASGSYGPLITDTGDTMTGNTQFTVAVNPANKGVKLRRRLDYSVLNQKAEVYVNGTLVGTWYDAGQNTTLSWRDSDFEIPAAYTQGLSSITIKIVYDNTGGTAWSEYDYWVYSYLDINDATPTTTASLPSGSYTLPQTVTLSCSGGSNADCYQTYYTTDGSDPTTTSSVYSSPITIAGNTTLKFFSLNLAGNAESVTTAAYMASGSLPSVSVSGGGSSSYNLSINGGAATTAYSSVTLSLYGTGAYAMEVSNTSTFAGATWGPYVATMPWTLASNTGEQTVYARYQDVRGDIMGSAEANITFAPASILPTPSIPSVSTSPVSPTSLSGMTVPQLQALLASLELELHTLEAKAGIGAVSSPPTPVHALSSYHFTRDLQSGMTGNDVKQLQLFLITQNIGSAARKLKANGTTQYFGILTKNALIKFQKSVGIVPASGYFGSITRGWVRENK